MLFWARICKRLWSPGIDSAGLCSLVGWYEKYGCRTGPPGWESVPGLLKRFTNTRSRVRQQCTKNFGCAQILKLSQKTLIHHAVFLLFGEYCTVYLGKILFRTKRSLKWRELPAKTARRREKRGEKEGGRRRLIRSQYTRTGQLTRNRRRAKSSH